LLTGLKGQAFLLSSKVLQHCPAHTISADVRRGDRLPRQLRRGLVGEGGAKLGGDGGAQRLQRPAIIILVIAADVDHLP
jgi:hypothetical protein